VFLPDEQKQKEECDDEECSNDWCDDNYRRVICVKSQPYHRYHYHNHLTTATTVSITTEIMANTCKKNLKKLPMETVSFGVLKLHGILERPL